MTPYVSSAEITVYAESEEDAEKWIENALRTMPGFDDVTFVWTNSAADEEDDDETP